MNIKGLPKSQEMPKESHLPNWSLHRVNLGLYIFKAPKRIPRQGGLEGPGVYGRFRGLSPK